MSGAPAPGGSSTPLSSAGATVPSRAVALVTGLAFVLVAAACGPSASPTPTTTATPAVSPSAMPSADGEPSGGPGQSPAPSTSSAALDDAVAGLVAALEENGATVTDRGPFSPDPFPGRGIVLCVANQEVRVYVFDTAAERAEVTGRIDPENPSNVGTSMVSWAGTPTFWQSDRIMVLYLGDDPALKSGLSGILGEPFASGEGGGPGPRGQDC